ncbi:hypothetical protein Agabi119p4_3920 [Agaricus bisporus var. burnettii]|uniref:Uncharacterized protein n=1 Tax=Agaricus bisporus var. burnettii TaxID=192524 RepID=A0A8H7KIF6_AGABI|nr:hypothetical protein Agabi119p4_3920 [Agaricus bisporus var. burnettii]
MWRNSNSLYLKHSNDQAKTLDGLNPGWERSTDEFMIERHRKWKNSGKDGCLNLEIINQLFTDPTFMGKRLGVAQPCLLLLLLAILVFMGLTRGSRGPTMRINGIGRPRLGVSVMIGGITAVSEKTFGTNGTPCPDSIISASETSTSDFHLLHLNQHPLTSMTYLSSLIMINDDGDAMENTGLKWFDNDLQLSHSSFFDSLPGTLFIDSVVGTSGKN